MAIKIIESLTLLEYLLFVYQNQVFLFRFCKLMGINFNRGTTFRII